MTPETSMHTPVYLDQRPKWIVLLKDPSHIWSGKNHPTASEASLMILFRFRCPLLAPSLKALQSEHITCNFSTLEIILALNPKPSEFCISTVKVKATTEKALVECFERFPQNQNCGKGASGMF